MLDELRGGQRERVLLSDRVTLKELKVGLLATLPSRDAAERVDVTADQAREGARLVVLAELARRVFESDFSRFGPTRRCCAVGERLRFSMDNLSALPDPNNGRVLEGAGAILPRKDVGHLVTPTQRS